jgi:Zn-dependent metalloprotease
MNKLLLTSSFLFFTFLTFAQKIESQSNETFLQSNKNIKEFKFNAERQSPSLIEINPEYNLNLQGVPGFLVEALQLDKNAYEFKEITTNTTRGNFDVVSFSAFYNGVKIEHARYNVVLKKGKVTAITLEHYVMGAVVSMSKSLSEDQALEKAKLHVGAENYVWQDIEKSLNATVNQKEVQQLKSSYNEYFPKGELVYVDNYKTKEVDLTLAYKFNIYASKPLSRNNIYVDATNGQILLTDAIIKHADDINKNIEKNKINTTNAAAAVVGPNTGHGMTRYAGDRNFETTFDEANKRYSLKGTIPVIVDGEAVIISNETLSYNGAGGTPIPAPGLPVYSIYDGDAPLGQLAVETGDNDWTADEHWRNRFETLRYPVDNETKNDDVALDAHWGAEIVIRYWADIHNRSSYDNKGTEITNYVHYGDAYDNAFWNGTAMTYGDGSYQGGTNPNGSFGPLTSMDVCGHEIGHGVCSSTSNLVYARESGAMNEGFSDIWAASVENYVLTQIDNSLPYDPWGIGEQIDENDGGLEPGTAGSTALRWMDDPKAEGNPDTYGGARWSDPECVDPNLATDQCGVHNNSGVLNKWYYLLVEGSGNAFTPGKGKVGADDQVNDVSNTYSVEGLGFLIAEQITFKAEILLTPNAKFQEMREASILVAQQEYGQFSNEEKQVTNAWYAVNVGGEFIGAEENQVFFEFSKAFVIAEKAAGAGCDAFTTVEVKVTGKNITSKQTIALDYSSSTATIGKDFSTDATSFTFDADGTKVITLKIFNDGIAEDVENIVIKFDVNTTTPVQNRTINFIITDEDYVPVIGNTAVEILREEFTSGFDMPSGWETKSALGTDPNVWLFNGLTLDTLGKAYVSVVGASEGATYNSTADGNLLLVSKLLNAKGLTNVTVAFDWKAGGETDQVDSEVYFDYGQFVYSFDGVNFTSLDKFAGLASGGAPQTGKYSKIINELDNRQFYIGWRWYNDSLLGTSFSFTVDNVVVSATAASVATVLAQSDTERVRVGEQLYFIDAKDGDVIGMIENASTDLDCVTLTVSETGTRADFTNIAGTHSGKVIKVATDVAAASYDLTLFYTNAEASQLSGNTISVIKVNSTAINDASPVTSNFQISAPTATAFPVNEYSTYKGTYTGPGTYALMVQKTLSIQNVTLDEFKIYPTVLSADKSITIISNKTAIDYIDIYAINGALVSSMKLESSNQAKVAVSKLASGMYFLVINGNRTDSHKFLIK